MTDQDQPNHKLDAYEARPGRIYAGWEVLSLKRRADGSRHFIGQSIYEAVVRVMTFALNHVANGKVLVALSPEDFARLPSDINAVPYDGPTEGVGE